MPDKEDIVEKIQKQIRVVEKNVEYIDDAEPGYGAKVHLKVSYGGQLYRLDFQPSSPEPSSMADIQRQKDGISTGPMTFGGEDPDDDSEALIEQILDDHRIGNKDLATEAIYQATSSHVDEVVGVRNSVFAPSIRLPFYEALPNEEAQSIPGASLSPELRKVFEEVDAGRLDFDRLSEIEGHEDVLGELAKGFPAPEKDLHESPLFGAPLISMYNDNGCPVLGLDCKSSDGEKLGVFDPYRSDCCRFQVDPTKEYGIPQKQAEELRRINTRLDAYYGAYIFSGCTENQADLKLEEAVQRYRDAFSEAPENTDTATSRNAMGMD